VSTNSFRLTAFSNAVGMKLYL